MTWPNTSSHKVGCAARLNSSTGSRRSFRSSAHATVTACRTNAVITAGSGETAGRTAGAKDLTVAASCHNLAAGELGEDVVERRRRADLRLQLGRGAGRHDPAEVHHPDPVAVRVRLGH